MNVFCNRKGNRRFTTSGAEILHSRHTTKDVGEEYEKNGANYQRAENTDRHVTLRIFRLLGCRRNRVEADKCEKDDSGCTENAQQAPVVVGYALRRHVGGWSRYKRCVIGRVHEPPTDTDNQNDDRYFQNNDEAIEQGRFFCSLDEKGGQKQQNEKGWNIDNSARSSHALERGVTPLIRNAKAKPVKHAVEVFAPGNGDRGGADSVLQHEIPADNPSYQLSHGCVGVGIGAARDRNHGSELGVTKPGKGATDHGDNKGEGD